jgi:transcriptional regulator with XRE-family HTH domain
VSHVDPSGAGTVAEFAQLLREVRRRAGDPSLEEMARRSGRILARSTMSEVLNGKRLPGREQLQAFLAVCGISGTDQALFLEAWTRLGLRPALFDRRLEGPVLSADALAKPQEQALEWPGGPVDSIEIDRRVVLWGASGSGKTCFLAALNAAVARAERQWSLVGMTDASAYLLQRATVSLIHHHRFPEATELGEFNVYQWVLTTDIELAIRRFGRRKSRTIPLRFQLEILDTAGEAFSGDHYRHIPTEAYHHLMDVLAHCDGIIYFYDAVSQMHGHDQSVYFHQVLDDLERKCHQDRIVDGARLPHRLAVCVSKFDEPSVFNAAALGGHLATDRRGPSEVPFVPDSRAKLFFEELCESLPEGKGNAPLATHSIRRYFHPDRVRYYATSAIGFYLDEARRFDAKDCNNASIQDGTNRIRGTIYPINVLEPLLWLQTPVSR